MKSRFEQLRPLDESEIAELPPLAWLIDQHLPENGLGVIYGKPKSGKTFIGVSMACAVSVGVPWLGFPVLCPTQVVYIYAEGWRSTHKRVLAWKQAHGIEKLSNFYAIPCPVSITDERDLNLMVAAIVNRGLKPGLIVIDTLARCFGGLNENSTQDMSKFVESCDSLRNDAFPGSTVLVVHHSGKDDAQGARGSSALLGAVDVEWEVCKGDSYDHIILRNTAQKDREEFEPRSMEKYDVPGTDSATVRWSEADPGTNPPQRDPACMATLRVLEDFCKAFDGNSVKRADWCAAAGLNMNTFNTHVGQLHRAGLVQKAPGVGMWKASPPSQIGA